MMSKNVGAVVFLSARKRRVGEDLSRLICRRRDASVSEYRGAGLLGDRTRLSRRA